MDRRYTVGAVILAIFVAIMVLPEGFSAPTDFVKNMIRYAADTFKAPLALILFALAFGIGFFFLAELIPALIVGAAVAAGAYATGFVVADSGETANDNSDVTFSAPSSN